MKHNRTGICDQIGRQVMLLATASVIVLAGAPEQAAADGNGAYENQILVFHLPAQPLSSALLVLAEQADLMVVASPELISGLQAPALEGRMTLSEALSRLLDGQGFGYEITPDRRLFLKFDNGEDLAAETSDGSDYTGYSSSLIQLSSKRHEIDKGPVQADTAKTDAFEEILITGSNIRGAEVVGSRLFVFGEEDFRRSGFTTVQDMMQSLPQNFGGGPNAVTAPLQGTENGAQFANRNFGASINLRGLGAGSTLTVVNGRRMAPVGAGTFVDISAIPLSAVERIEVLPDGASAIYGTDAIAGVTNIILRSDYEGAETGLRFGTVTDGGQQDYKASQIFGTRWTGGGAFVAYEYQHIEALFSAERDFAESSDLRPRGGADYRMPFANPGTLLAGGLSFAIPRGQEGRSLTGADLVAGTVNAGNERLETTLLPEQERYSVYVSLDQELSDRLSFSAEGLYTRRTFEGRRTAETQTLTVPSTNPFFVDPVGGQPVVQVRYSFLDDLGPRVDTGKVESWLLTTGVRLELASDWQAEAHGSYSGSRENGGFASGTVNKPALAAALADPDPATAFNPFGDGSYTNPATLANIEGFLMSSQKLDLWTLDVKSDGPLFAIPGGMVKLAVGGHYRRENWFYDRVDFEFFATPEYSVVQDSHRDVVAAFTEILVPLVGEGNRVPGIETLSFSAAFRVEDYSDFGSTTNPRLGLDWSPVAGLSLRGTYGTSFRAPILTQRDASRNQVFFFPLPDPKSPTGVSNAILLTGNDPDLGPETATTWTAGIDWQPAILPRFGLFATYFETRFKDRLGQLTDLGLLAREDVFGPLIMRSPNPASVATFFSDPRFVNVVGSTDPNDVDVLVNAQLTNLGRTTLRGLDLTAQYGTDTAIGDFSLQVNASILFDFKEAVTETAPFVDLVDTLDRPVDWRLRNSLSWSRGGMTATLFVNYTDGYRNANVLPAEPVGNWTTADLTISYSTGTGPAISWLRNIGFTFSVFNLTNARPPFVNNPRGIAFDPEKANPQGRFIAVAMTKRW